MVLSNLWSRGSLLGTNAGRRSGARRRRRLTVLWVALFVALVGISSLVTATPSSHAGAAVTFGPRSAAADLPRARVGTLVNWPCAGCVVFVPSAYNPKVPTALLVALHGDEGVSSLITTAFTPAVSRANVILFAPQCPTDEGCRLRNGTAGHTNSWWGWLQYSTQYDDHWISREVGAIAARYNLDRRREYLAGWSGGADYLGWYAPTHASQFAAAAFVAGGTPYDPSCPSERFAGYFLMGSADFRYLSGQPTQVAAVLRHCGDPTKMIVLSGDDHQGTITAVIAQGYATRSLAWLLRHHLTPR